MIDVGPVLELDEEDFRFRLRTVHRLIASMAGSFMWCAGCHMASFATGCGDTSICWVVYGVLAVFTYVFIRARSRLIEGRRLAIVREVLES